MNKENHKDSTFEEDNLLKPLQDDDFSTSQNLFHSEHRSDQEVKLTRAAELNSNLLQLESEMLKTEISQLKTEILALKKDTKTMIQVVDKILPRDEDIWDLLDIGGEKQIDTEHEIDQILLDGDEDQEISITKTIHVVKMIRKSIINLKNMGYKAI